MTTPLSRFRCAQHPTMAEGIRELGEPVAPEHVLSHAHATSSFVRSARLGVYRAPGAPSAMPFRLASPFSNSVPIILSMLMKRPMAFDMKPFSPSIAHVTLVPDPAGVRV